jgi:hypothetical protein
MTVPLLVAALVRQTTVLIAQLATTGGVRAPLAQVADQVFFHLVRELERQGISRKISADMFGMGLRSYLRRIQRLSESSTERGHSLWEAVLAYLHEQGAVTRGQVLERFFRDEEAQVRAVLHDLTASGLVFASGTGAGSVYRAAGEDEIGALTRAHRGEGLDELVWALVYRLGPVSRDELSTFSGETGGELDATLERLVEASRVDRVPTPEGTRYSTTTFFVPRGTTAGFEASVFDHFQAVVQTICCRLRGETTKLPLGDVAPGDTVGGSTYSFELWPGHPFADQVIGTLAQYRTRLSALRAEVEAYNAEVGIPEQYEQVTSYCGQCAIPQDGRAP